MGFIPNPFPEQNNSGNSLVDSSIDFSPSVPPVRSYDLAIKPWDHLGVNLGQHWTIVGKSGSGKTRFAVGLMEYLRRQYPTAKRYVLDSTSDGIVGAYNPLYIEGDIPPGIARDSVHTVIWQPDTDTLENYDSWLTMILKKKQPAIVFLDETASLLTKSGNPVPGFMKILKQGRKHGISVINLSQETTKVPLTMFRQMTHYCQFRLLLGDTTEVVSARRLLGVDRDHELMPIEKHSFFYRNVPDSFPPKEFRNMQEFFSTSLNGGKQRI